MLGISSQARPLQAISQPSTFMVQVHMVPGETQRQADGHMEVWRSNSWQYPEENQSY
jgi:hypothetical protein